MKRKITLLIMACIAIAAQAIPAWRGWHKHTQPDGTTIEYRLLGDEYCHALVARDGRQLLHGSDGSLQYVGDKPLDFADFYAASRSEKAGQRRVLGDNFPTKGTVKGLVLLAEFADNSFQPEYTREVFDAVMNEENCSLYQATGSSRDYFIAQSMGQFTPHFDVVGPVKLPRIMQYYGANNSQGNDRNAGQMISDACKLAHDSLGIDFSQYDYNDDGEVDFVYVIYAGYAESYGASSNTIWPHAANLTDMGVSCYLKGKHVQRYACSCELKYSTGTQLEGIGTFCHEFGHVLGLPDMYNTYQQNRIQLGSWDIMDVGTYNNESRTPPAYSAFERYSLGWLDFIDIDTPADTMELLELTQNNTAYRIVTPGNPNEYFTLENRQQIGWDRYLPGGGLMIIHVNYDKSAWNMNAVNSGINPRYDLVEADGRQGQNLPTNLFPTPTNDMFTDYSTPNSLSWDGIPTEKGVTDIRIGDDGEVRFRFMHDRLKRPELLPVTHITTTAATLNWNAVSEAQSYRVSLREVLPDALNPLLLDEDFSQMTEKNGFTDLSSSLDNYTSQSGWSGSEVYEAGGRVRIGAYGTDGRLTTPAVNTVDSFTLAFLAASYPGKTVSYTVSLIDAVTGNTIERRSLKANKNETEQIITFANAPTRLRVSFETQRERLFLNRIRLLSDTLSGVWTAGPRSWVIDSIADTSYRVESLVEGRTYYYYVQALAEEALRSSLPSAEGSFTTTTTTGLPAPTDLGATKPAYFDLQGRRLSAPPLRGIYLKRTGDVVRKVFSKHE